MINNNPSLYKLVLAAAERANQITNGSKPLVDCSSKKATTIALNEIAAGQVHFELTEDSLLS
jgi:DNA-directed RNA polymerase subunit omega